MEYREKEGKREGLGEKGRAVTLQGEEKALADSLFKKEAFNIIASDKIALDRSIPDVRDSRYDNTTHTHAHTLSLSLSLKFKGP